MNITVEQVLEQIEELIPSFRKHIISSFPGLYEIENNKTTNHIFCSIDWQHRYTTDNRIEIIKRCLTVLENSIITKLSAIEKKWVIGDIILRRIATIERDGVEIQINYAFTDNL